MNQNFTPSKNDFFFNQIITRPKIKIVEDFKSYKVDCLGEDW